MEYHKAKFPTKLLLHCMDTSMPFRTIAKKEDISYSKAGCWISKYNFIFKTN